MRTDHLRKLVTIHSGERPFTCDLCDKCYVYKNQLTVHLRIHSGERLFKCDVCDKSVTQKSVLNTHLAIHSGNRPFKCDVCDEIFFTEGSFIILRCIPIIPVMSYFMYLFYFCLLICNSNVLSHQKYLINALFVHIRRL